MINELDKFRVRLEKLGITIQCSGNYPWIYLTYVNGKFVTEKYLAKHGFTIAWLSVYGNVLTDLPEIFKIIRKYR